MKEFEWDTLPIVDIVNEIISDAISQNASDIHLDQKEKDLLIRIRIDGDLINYSLVPPAVKKNLVTRIKIIAGMNITETRLPQDGAIKTTINKELVDMRVSSLPTSYGEKVVIRILDYTRSLSGLDSLGFTKRNYDRILKLISIPNGIILVTGATGSGKSTTVYSILQSLNTEDVNIITVEDPVEMRIEGINQLQVNHEIGLTFGSALRSILRQDPDIIMIGEIRDDETARIAVRASITGHLVLSTIHTNNSLNTIERLLDMEVERYLLGTALAGIISQKLARSLCPNCKRIKENSDYEKNIFKTALKIDVKEIYEPVGCDKCHGGYSGRVAIHEILLINQEIRDAITGNLRKESLRKLVYSSDVTTMLQDGLEKVISGDTSFEEILKLIDLDDDISSHDQDNLKIVLEDSINSLHATEKFEL